MCFSCASIACALTVITDFICYLLQHVFRSSIVSMNTIRVCLTPTTRMWYSTSSGGTATMDELLMLEYASWGSIVVLSLYTTRVYIACGPRPSFRSVWQTRRPHGPDIGADVSTVETSICLVSRRCLLVEHTTFAVVIACFSYYL